MKYQIKNLTACSEQNKIKGYINMHIKKKLIAMSIILAITASFAACSDKNDKDEAEATLTSEEFIELTKHELSIEPFVPATDVEQDAVENSDGDSSNADNNNPAGGNANNNNQEGNQGGGNANNNNAQEGTQGGNGDPTSGSVIDSPGNNNVDIPADTGLKVISGTKTLLQAYWMDLSKYQDHVFNGEYMVAEFKIKEDAKEGIYPITIDWLDFSNWDAVDVDFTSIDGAIVVGGEVKENTFNDGDEPQLMVQNVSGKPGDIVKVSFNIKNNPGVVACLLRFGYNSDALEYYDGGAGADFSGDFQS